MSSSSLRVGDAAPDFEGIGVLNEEFIPIRLADCRGQKYVILLFYPLDFTFVCPTELMAFNDRYADFVHLNTEIIGISVDSPYSHLAWLQTPPKEGGLGSLGYPLLSDLKKNISQSYNVLTDDGVALRGLFILDQEGIVQHATINNLAFGRSVGETLRTLKAIQHIQEHTQQVCPVDWHPGEPSLTPDRAGIKQYFERNYT